MPLLLLIVFIAVPIVEISVIDQIQGAIGWPLTILLLFLDSLVGAVLVRREGQRAWRAFREALAAGRWPGDEVTQGALILVGGALLLTPGFVTDAVGLALVLPPTRALISGVVRRRVTPPQVRVIGDVLGGDDGATARGSSPGGGPGDAGEEAVDVEVVSVERDTDRP